MKQSHIILIWVLLLCFAFCSCNSLGYEQADSSDIDNVENKNKSSSELDDISLQLEEENMGYDLAWVERVGPTLRIFVAVDFDRNIQTEMYVHNRRGGDYTYTDHVQTTNISGDIVQGWQKNYMSIDTHIYYEYSIQEDGKGIITEYDYQYNPSDTYFEQGAGKVTEMLNDGLEGMELKEVAKVMRPEGF